MHTNARRMLRKAAVATVASALSAATVLSTVALAAERLGWETGDIVNNPEGIAETYTPSGTAEFVKQIIQAAIFIVVGAFVLRIVLTAIDRLILAGNGNEGFRLDEVPLVGAYRDPERGGADRKGVAWTWTRIFSHFALQLVLCLSAWVFVEFLMGVIKAVADMG